MFNTPILFLIFNRPQNTQMVFDAIKKQKPKFLFIAADGARPRNKEDIEKCKTTRDIVLKGIDWECEVKTLFREENLGCGVAVSEAITWFFSFVEKGIILEDDTLPNSSFFSFCENMLDYYKFDLRIMHISGNCYANDNISTDNYYFTKLPFIWGWATWRRAWELYDFDLKYMSFEDRINLLENTFDNLEIVEYWNSVLQNFHLTPKSYTWDFQWFLSIWKNKSLVIQPSVNLVQNIGFGKEATHTIISEHYLGNLKAKSHNVKTYLTKISLNSLFQDQNFYYYFKKQNNKLRLDMIFKDSLYNFKMKLGKLIYQFLYFYSENTNLVYQFGLLKNKVNNSFISKKAKLYPIFKIQNSKIGDFTYVAKNAILNNTNIGKYCSIGPNLVSGGGIHPINGISTHPMFYSTLKQNGMTLSHEDKIDEIKTVNIGNDVFIGMNVTILDGVSIGDGAVIGAGAVVSKDIPAYAIAAGNPIKVIKYRFNEEIINSLLKIKWWDFREEQLNLVEQKFYDIEGFIKILEEKI